MPDDAYHGDDTVELIRAMALPLASAQNYLAGVQVRARYLTELPRGSEAASGQILDGITRAIRHLQDVASMIEDRQREGSHGACTHTEHALLQSSKRQRIWWSPGSRRSRERNEISAPSNGNLDLRYLGSDIGSRWNLIPYRWARAARQVPPLAPG